MADTAQLTLAHLDAARARVPSGLWAALSHLEQGFVAALLLDPKMEKAKAARVAGYSPRTAKSVGHEVANRPRVKAALAALMAERAERAELSADDVLRRWWAIARANPNEVVSFRRACCRWCYGEGHRYNYTPAEHAKAKETWEGAAVKSRGPNPDEQGGIGFDRRKTPHPDCPECFGEGVGTVFITDTRHLRGDAAILYAGVKESDKGIEVKLQDQGAALVNVARHLGMFAEREEQPADEAARATALRAQLDAMDAQTVAA